MSLLGRPNSGKSTLINYLKMYYYVRADPPFDTIILIHPEGENNSEYSDVNATSSCLSELPAPIEWRVHRRQDFMHRR